MTIWRETKSWGEYVHIRLACSCHCPYTTITFSKLIGNDNIEDHDMVIESTVIAPFWRRLWWGFRYMIGKDNLVYGDIIMSEDDLKEIYEFINAEVEKPKGLKIGRLTEG